MIHTPRAHLNVEAQTHPGMTGKNNEDRYAVASFVLGRKNRMPVLFAVLADGIGGHRGGEVAAELAVNHIMQEVAQSDGRHIRQTIERAVTEASDAIAAHSASKEDLKGMGSTCATAWIIGDRLYTAYVGDSRIYLMRSGRIQQLTVDHTWVQEAIEKGVITPEKAREHPNVHVIRRYLGSPSPPEPDFRMRFSAGGDDQLTESNQGVQLLPDDVLLLCSDGLTDLVWNDEILEVVRSKPNLKEAAQTLIELANTRGGHDNITVVLISVPSNFKMIVKNNADWLPWIIGRRGGPGIRSDRRFFPDPQPAEAEHNPDPHPDRFPDALAYPDSFTPANCHCCVTAYSNIFTSRAVARPAHIHTLADEYTVINMLLRLVKMETSRPSPK